MEEIFNTWGQQMKLDAALMTKIFLFFLIGKNLIESYLEARNKKHIASNRNQVPERFAQAIASIEHGFDPERFLAREALSIGKRKIAEGSTREALAMASAALTRDPSQMRAWMLGPAALAARAVPRLAARWRRSA